MDVQAGQFAILGIADRFVDMAIGNDEQRNVRKLTTRNWHLMMGVMASKSDKMMETIARRGKGRACTRARPTIHVQKLLSHTTRQTRETQAGASMAMDRRQAVPVTEHTRHSANTLSGIYKAVQHFGCDAQDNGQNGLAFERDQIGVFYYE